jgi:hypothetical protein
MQLPCRAKGQLKSRTGMSGAAAKPLLAIIILLTGGSLAFGQAGSIGGTIGKTDKSVSGVEEPRAPAKSRSKGQRRVDGGGSDQSSQASGAGRNPVRAQCPDIDGVWNSPSPSSVSEIIRQTGCRYSATLTTLLFNHAISGRYLGDSNYSLTIVRTNKATGCTTVMYGRMTSVSGAGFQTITSGTDGRCDLPANFTETRSWTR